jgi:tetraacyldisaccharide 4'-kinase
MGRMVKYLRFLLMPFAAIYGLALLVRNTLFDQGILKSTRPRVATICIGNLTVGGTGKTPMAEYVISLLQDHCQMAYLSRGYKRKTKGFVLANSGHKPDDIGDEPFQVGHKFTKIKVAVDADRVRGIQNIMEQLPQTQAIVLDDAYQHRYVLPGLSILLTDYNRLFYTDWLMPVGRLREYAAGKKRADMIIVTKCPRNLDRQEMDMIRGKIKPLPHQKVFFAALAYQPPRPLLTTKDQAEQKPWPKAVLLVTGIANPGPLSRYLAEKVEAMEVLTYPDHHFYHATDFKKIKQSLEQLQGREKAIVITEKDAAKWISAPDMDPLIGELALVLPVGFEILSGQKEALDQTLLNYVASHQ